MRWPAFHRARRYGEVKTPGRVAVIAFGVVAALLVCLLILLAGLLLDLLDTTGDLTVSRDEAAEAEGIAGSPDEATPTVARYYNRGLLSLVWRLRGTPIGPPAATLYSASDVWGNNVSALLTLFIVALAVAAIAALTMDRLERANSAACHRRR